jgi:hypothetical protein
MAPAAVVLLREPQVESSLVEAEILIVQALVNQVNELSDHDLTGVGVVANWLARRVVPLKKQLHPKLEYCGVHDTTQESSDNIEVNKLMLLLKELFQNTNS